MPIVWLVVRNEPLPEKTFESTTNDQERDVENLSAQPADLTVWEALGSAAFWVFALASSAFGLAYSGIALFNESILKERGFDVSTYYLALVVTTLLGLAANFAGGWLATKWPIQRVMGIGMAVLAVALLALPHVTTQTHVLLYAVAFGIAGGIVTVVFFSVWGQVFGRRQLGRIQGCAQMLTVLASAIGPLLLAQTLERTGSYSAMFNILAGLVSALAVGSWLVRLPYRSPQALRSVVTNAINETS